MKELFADGYYTREVVLVGALIGLGLLGVMAHFSRNLFLKVLDSLAFQRSSIFFSKLNIHLPPELFVLLARIHQALLAALSLFALTARLDYLPLNPFRSLAALSVPGDAPVRFSPDLVLLLGGATGEWLAEVLLLLTLTLAVALVLAAGRIGQRLWNALFLKREARLRHTQYTRLADLAWSWLLYPGLILLSAPIPILYPLLFYALLFLLWRLHAVLFSASLLMPAGMPPLHFFLYLCTQEVAPPLFLTGWILRGGLS